MKCGDLTKVVELNEMKFAHANGKLRRYIIVKKQVDVRPESTGEQFFEDEPGDRYSCYVTNLDLPLDRFGICITAGLIVKTESKNAKMTLGERTSAYMISGLLKPLFAGLW